MGLPLGVRRFKRRNTCAAWRTMKPNKPPKPLPFPSISFTFFPRIEPYQWIARSPGPRKKFIAPLPGQSRIGPGVGGAGMTQNHHGALILSKANSIRATVRSNAKHQASPWELPRERRFGRAFPKRPPPPDWHRPPASLSDGASAVGAFRSGIESMRTMITPTPVFSKQMFTKCSQTTLFGETFGWP